MATKTGIGHIVSIVFRGVALAMGVSVVVLNLLGVAAPQTTGVLLGLGLFTLALDALDKES